MLNLNYVEVAYICCDKCRTTVQLPAYGKSSLIREARKLGWAVGKRCLCPQCRDTLQSNQQYGTRRGRDAVEEVPFVSDV